MAIRTESELALAVRNKILHVSDRYCPNAPLLAARTPITCNTVLWVLVWTDNRAYWYRNYIKMEIRRNETE